MSDVDLSAAPDAGAPQERAGTKDKSGRLKELVDDLLADYPESATVNKLADLLFKAPAAHQERTEPKESHSDSTDAEQPVLSSPTVPVAQSSTPPGRASMGRVVDRSGTVKSDGAPARAAEWQPLPNGTPVKNTRAGLTGVIVGHGTIKWPSNEGIDIQGDDVEQHVYLVSRRNGSSSLGPACAVFRADMTERLT